MAVFHVNDSTFEQEVLRSELPVLVDLYAEWCAPCKQLSPLVETLAAELEGLLKVAKVDVDQSPMVAQTFQAKSIPMLLLIAGGRVVDQHVGVLDKAALRRFIEPALPRSAAELMPNELAQLVAQGKAVAVDIRDVHSFQRYRIPGAAHVPSDQVATRVQELQPTDGRIRVLYGRTSDEAKKHAESLRAQGVQVGFLSGGFLHWEADGLEVERG